MSDYSTTKDLGAVTAYASAVEGGYKGTYEEFCSLLGSFTSRADEVKTNTAAVEKNTQTATEAAQAASNSASSAQAAAEKAEKAAGTTSVAGVAAFNGRAGEVAPEAGDYTAAQVSYDGTTSGLTGTTAQAAIDEVAASDAKKAVKADVDDALATKADTTTVNDALAAKADQTVVDEALGKKADQTAVDEELGKKADKTDVDTELGKKADTEAMTTALALKADQTAVDEAVGKKQDNLGIKSIGSNLILSDAGVLDAKAQEVTVDTALSNTSKNPVANDVITRALALKADTSAVTNGLAAKADTSITDQIMKNTAAIETAGNATNAHAVGEYVMISNALYRVTAAVAAGDAWTIGTNVEMTNVGAELASLKSASILFRVYMKRVEFGNDQTYNVPISLDSVPREYIFRTLGATSFHYGTFGCWIRDDNYSWASREDNVVLDVQLGATKDYITVTTGTVGAGKAANTVLILYRF